MKCENCGGTIIDITTTNIENIDARCNVKFKGRCCCCHSLYQWEEIYELIDSTIPELVVEKI